MANQVQSPEVLFQKLVVVLEATHGYKRKARAMINTESQIFLLLANSIQSLYDIFVTNFIWTISDVHIVVTLIPSE